MGGPQRPEVEPQYFMTLIKSGKNVSKSPGILITRDVLLLFHPMTRNREPGGIDSGSGF